MVLELRLTDYDLFAHIFIAILHVTLKLDRAGPRGLDRDRDLISGIF